MSALTTGILIAAAAAIFGLIVWSVQRIINRIDSIGNKIEGMNLRLTLVESKQDEAVGKAAEAAYVGRKVGVKVGLLPKELEQTLQPARRRNPTRYSKRASS